MSPNTRVASKLVLIVIGMFGFGYALVPIYDALCELTGLNGKTASIEQTLAESMTVDESRTITVEFIANLNQGLSWGFEPQVNKMEVHPGRMYIANYFAENKSSEAMVGQAVPSVAPAVASSYFKKVDCFCFDNQTIEAGARKLMPVQFIIDPDLPDNVDTVSLSYTFFDVTSTATLDSPKSSNKL